MYTAVHEYMYALLVHKQVFCSQMNLRILQHSNVRCNI